VHVVEAIRHVVLGATPTVRRGVRIGHPIVKHVLHIIPLVGILPSSGPGRGIPISRTLVQRQTVGFSEAEEIRHAIPKVEGIQFRGDSVQNGLGSILSFVCILVHKVFDDCGDLVLSQRAGETRLHICDSCRHLG